MLGHISTAEIFGLLAMMAVTIALVAYPAGRICSRLGFSPWLGVLAMVPFLNVLLLLYVAFSPWPVNVESRSRLGHG